jgi:TPR repeat protein
MHQIKLTAEIAWMDSANKSGGLRFTEFTADAENQIRQWLTKTRESEAPDGNFVIPSRAPKEATDHCSDAPSDAPGPLPASPVLDNATPSSADAAALPAPVQISEPSAATTLSVPSPIPETSANETIAAPDSAASPQTTQDTANSTDSRAADLQNSQQHFGEVHLKKGRSDPARQLWSALAAGDSSAELALALAQLYLTGDGVPRNCEQARILLRAAAKNGNSEALQKLRTLKNGPCR